MSGIQESRVIVFGGAGFIGTHLVNALRHGGCEVLVADLKAPVDRAVPYCTVDVRQPIPVALMKFDADVAINLAAVHRSPGHKDREYYDTNVGGAMTVTAWCRESHVRKLMFTSSIAVYGPSEAALSEISACRPNSAYGRSKLMAEGIHRLWSDQDQANELVVLRPSVVFGPGEGGNFTRLARALEKRRFAFPGRVDTIKSCISVWDLVAVHLFVLGSELWNRKVLTANVSYPAAPSIKEICDAFCEIGGYSRPPQLPVSQMIKVLASLPRPLGDLGNRMRKLTASTNVEPLLLKEAGFHWETDLHGGLLRWREAAPLGVFV